MTTCQACRSRDLDLLREFGPQPIMNRFHDSPGGTDECHPMTVVQCRACSLIQLSEHPTADQLRPRVDWISYAEPEAHLDRLAEHLTALPGITADSRVHGLSFKDDPLLQRMERRGFRHTWRADLRRDLGIEFMGAGVETIQDRVTRQGACRPAGDGPGADLLVARHILEHAHDLGGFWAALGASLNPGGYLVIEVPDCYRSFRDLDNTTLWEEHIVV